jgi:hypothetical protein
VTQCSNILNSLSSEKPGEKEWLELEKQKVPLLLNFSQCKLYEKEYYSVIEHCSTVLKSDPGESDNIWLSFEVLKNLAVQFKYQ